MIKIKQHSPVLCNITITTDNDDICKIIEPNVCLSTQRFEAIKTLSSAGIFTGVLLMPVLPHITDTSENIRNLVRLSYENGAKFIFASFGVTLRANQRDYYYEMLDKHFPALKRKYAFTYYNGYNCSSLHARGLRQIFVHECKKYKLLYRMSDIIKAYKKEYGCKQLLLPY